MYSVVESKDRLFKVGINENIYLANARYNANAGKGGSAAEAIELIYSDKNENQITDKIWRVTEARVRMKDGVPIETEEEALNRQYKELSEKVTHIAKVLGDMGVFNEGVAKVANADADEKFKVYAEAFVNCLVDNFRLVALRLKLHYQWKQTYLQVPRNMKTGAFLERMDVETSRLTISDWEKKHKMRAPEAPVNVLEGITGGDDNEFEYNIEEL